MEIVNLVESGGADHVLSSGMVDFDLSLIFMLGLFLVFAFLLHAVILKPLIAAQEVRHKGMGGAREDASSFELKAAEMRLDYDKRLSKARQEAVVIREEIKRTAETEAQTKVAATQGEIDVKVAAAKGELAKFAVKARAEMNNNSEKLADELAHKLLGETA
jgi:F0F1-type ATP synthase membrane subunit b/b'